MSCFPSPVRRRSACPARCSVRSCGRGDADHFSRSPAAGRQRCAQARPSTAGPSRPIRPRRSPCTVNDAAGARARDSAAGRRGGASRPQRQGLHVLLRSPIRRCTTIACSCGSATSARELTFRVEPDELAEAARMTAIRDAHRALSRDRARLSDVPCAGRAGRGRRHAVELSRLRREPSIAAKAST